MTIAFPRLHACLGLVLAVGFAACGESTTTGPTQPPPATLSIACPTGATGVSHNGQPATVTWTAPATTGGAAPVTVTCTPASGSAFATGTTSVTCRATDAGTQAASCTFPVTVTAIPRISVTRFLAFGDSLTEGKSQTAPALPMFIITPVVNPASYPFKLGDLLSARYADQTVSVVNVGYGGEVIADGLNRLPGELAVHSPEVLLLLDGANDLLGNPSDTTTTYIAGKLREMVRTAKSRVFGIKVLLATFPPQTKGTYPYDRGAGRDFVPSLNQKIADVARSENAVLVDLYAGFPADTASLTKYISVDGLHPTPDGYTLMAQIFFASVRTSFEIGGPDSPTFGR
ncbi:MAG: GDSL-type esterase/lipase family protein [Acidobacteria bacterium]|nr:GDSL-type esterase/lipase family protein [Acidobacteriota bacterium]